MADNWRVSGPQHYTGRLIPATFDEPLHTRRSESVVPPARSPQRQRNPQGSQLQDSRRAGTVIVPDRESSVVSYADPAQDDPIAQRATNPAVESQAVPFRRRSNSPSLPPRDPASVLERFRAFPISELIFPDHLRLRDATTWKAYKNAVQLVCALKGVEKHLERPAISEHRAPAWWNEEERLCRAIILLNILDIGRFDLDDCTFTVECWEELKRVHEPPVRTRPKETLFDIVRASFRRTFARRWVWLLIGWWIGVFMFCDKK